MAQTDRQTDKSTRWAFTAYEAQWGLFNDMPPSIAEWGWQKEVCPETGREHYQGYLRTKQQVRLKSLVKDLPGVHFEIARNWSALTNYCRKDETAVSGTQVHQTSGNMRTIYSLAKEVAAALPPLALLEDEFEEIRLRIRNNTTRGLEPNYGTFNVSSWEEYFLYRVDSEVKFIIKNGGFDAAWLASNPQWLCMWRKYGKEYLAGYHASQKSNDNV